MSDSKPLTVGDRVRLIVRPPYFKTADPMPMLRPPDVVHVGEEGTILQQRYSSTWVVKFNRGAFLTDSQYLELVSATPESTGSD